MRTEADRLNEYVRDRGEKSLDNLFYVLASRASVVMLFAVAKSWWNTRLMKALTTEAH